MFWVTYIAVHLSAGSISSWFYMSAWMQSSLLGTYRNRYMMVYKRSPLQPYGELVTLVTAACISSNDGVKVLDLRDGAFK